jgi:hypothetical protein
MVESWRGGSWSIVPSPTPGTYGGLSGVSCSSVKWCVAVGSYSTGTGSGASAPGRTLVESWDGTTWSVASNPGPSIAYLFGASCASVKRCQAVGEYQATSGLFRALIESWDGTAWSVAPNPSPLVAYLYGVSCHSAKTCEAVGQFTNKVSGAGPADVLVESWNGAAWST